MNNNKLIKLAKLAGFELNKYGLIIAPINNILVTGDYAIESELNKFADLILDHQSDCDAIAWQRYAPNLNRWIEVLPDDIKHYKNMGQKIRELYTLPSTSINDAKIIINRD